MQHERRGTHRTRLRVAGWALASLVLLIRPASVLGQVDDRRATFGVGPVSAVSEGARIRVTTPDSTLQGTLVEASAGDWVLDPDGPERGAVTLPTDSIRRIEILVGMESDVLEGMGIGLLIGGASGALLGMALASDDAIMSRNSQIGAGAFFLGVIGTVVGGVVGGIPRDRWEEVSPRPSMLRISPGPEGGATLSATLRF